jgi:hypothetical protein
MSGGREQHTQRLLQRLLGKGLVFGVHHRLKVVQEHHHRLPEREGLQDRSHHLRRRVVRVLIQALQSPHLVGRHQMQQVAHKC